MTHGIHVELHSVLHVFWFKSAFWKTKSFGTLRPFLLGMETGGVNYFANSYWDVTSKQECIPVGCVLAARRPYAGICFPGGWGGLLPGGVSAPGGWCLLPGGLLRGGIPACTEADPPVNRMTDRCKNITLATTSLWPVIRPIKQLNEIQMREIDNECEKIIFFDWTM